MCPHPRPIFLGRLLTVLQNVVLSVPFAFRMGLLLWGTVVLVGDRERKCLSVPQCFIQFPNLIGLLRNLHKCNYVGKLKNSTCESLYIFILLLNWYLSFFGRRSVLVCVVCLKLWWFSFHIITFEDWWLLSVFFHMLHIFGIEDCSVVQIVKCNISFKKTCFSLNDLFICVLLSSCEHCVCMLWSDWESKG